MLEFNPTFLITIVNIAILFAILKLVLWKPMTKFLDARARKVSDDLERASAERARAEELRQRYEATLRDAQAEGERQAREIIAQAGEKAERIEAEARVEAEAIKARGRRELESERAAAAAKLRSEAASLALLAAAKVLGRAVDDEDSRRLALETVEREAAR